MRSFADVNLRRDADVITAVPAAKHVYPELFHVPSTAQLTQFDKLRTTGASYDKLKMTEDASFDKLRMTEAQFTVQNAAA